MKLTVIVKPNSSVDEVRTQENGTLLVRVKAPPHDGKANEKLIELLAVHFHKPKSRIILLRGASSRIKIVEIG